MPITLGLPARTLRRGVSFASLSAASSASGLRLPGTAGNYASTPDSVLNSVTGDIDIRVCAKLDDWTPAAVQTPIAKFPDASGQRSFMVRVTAAGRLDYYWSTTGAATPNALSTVSVPFADGVAGWFRVTHDVDNGSGQNVVTFYTSTDGITWTPLGAAVTATGTTHIFDGTAPLLLGLRDAGANHEAMAGTIYYAEVRNGIDGPVAAKFDASTVSSSGAQVPATINGWTPNGSALYRRDDYVRLPGTAGNYLSFPDTVANSVTSDLDLRAKVSMDDWTPAADSVLLSKWNALPAWRFYVDTAGSLRVAWWTSGAVEHTAVSSVAPTVVDGAVKWMRVTIDVDNGAAGRDVKFYTSDDGVTWTQLGSTSTTAGTSSIRDNSDAIEIGSRDAGASNRLAGNVYAAEVRSGIGGDVVASFDARDITTPWTVNGTGWSWEGASFAGKPTTALDLSGVDYVSTPDSAGVSIVGDIDLRVKVAMDDWTPAANSAFVGKWTATGNQRAYVLNITTTGIVRLQYSDNGTTNNIRSSTVAVGAADGAVKWVRGTLDVDNGATGHDVKFYTSDDGVTWTQLGATVTTAGVASIFDSTAVVEVGSIAVGTVDVLAGKVHYAEVRSGIDGPIVARFDPTAIARTGTRTPTTTVQPGGTPNMLTPNQASIETDTTGWAGDANTTIARSTAQFLDGAASLSLTAIAIGLTQAGTPTGTSGKPVVAGKMYTVSASYRAAVTARVTRTFVNWYTAAGAYLATSGAANPTDSSSAWTAGAVSVLAPATAAFAAVFVTINDATQLATEVHYVDRVALVESAATWTMNGSSWDLVEVA